MEMIKTVSKMEQGSRKESVQSMQEYMQSRQKGMQKSTQCVQYSVQITKVGTSQKICIKRSNKRGKNLRKEKQLGTIRESLQVKQKITRKKDSKERSEKLGQPYQRKVARNYARVHA